jgi:hypothetical protein
MREYRRKHRLGLRSYNRVYNKAWRHEHGYANEYAWTKKHPVKVRAQNKAQNFIEKYGIAYLPCQCGKKRTVMHHRNYLRPLEVDFLCPVHHRHTHLGWLKLTGKPINLTSLISIA